MGRVYLIYGFNGPPPLNRDEVEPGGVSIDICEHELRVILKLMFDGFGDLCISLF